MMYVASCPLRISLFGGSTDNPYFVDKYGRGSVISFSSNLKAYITLHEDKMGFNKVGRKYIVNYSRREEVDTVGEIQNEIVRHPLDYFGCHPINVTMKSDAYSQGSGLASSSAYTIALIKALSMYYGNDLTDIEICELSYKLELLSNKYAGYQDPYGCGIGGFKRIEFEKGNIIKYDFLSQDLFRHYDMHLIFTGVTRNAEDVSADVTKNLHKIKPLLKTADQAFDTLLKKDYEKFLYLMKRSWQQKKETSSVITQNPIIKEIDNDLDLNDTVLAHRLCGAGNGGFFLTFSEKGTLNVPHDAVKVHVTPQGVSGVII